MSKSIHLNHSFQTRSANFSTHGSRKGINLLGWSEEEFLNPEQERDALVARAKQLQQIFEEKNYTVRQKSYLVSEYQYLTKRINEIRPKMKCKGIENYIMDILRETLTKTEWNRLHSEAKRRYAIDSRGQE